MTDKLETVGGSSDIFCSNVGVGFEGDAETDNNRRRKIRAVNLTLMFLRRVIWCRAWRRAAVVIC